MRQVSTRVLVMLGVVMFGCVYAQAPDTLWMKVYGGPHDDYGNGVCETHDHGLILTGMSSTSGAGDLYVVRTDHCGDSLWTHAYGGAYWDHGYSIQPTPDNGFITAGYTCSYSVDNNEDFFLVKIDSAGGEQWFRHYGGDSLDAAYCVAVTSDSGYIVTGRTYSYGSGDADIYCVRTDASGDTLWTHTYGGPADEGSYGVLERDDDGFLIIGHTASYGAGNSDVYIVCIDDRGDTVWTRTYGGAGFDFAYGVTATSDHGFVIVGKTRSYGSGSWDMYVIKVDQNGDSLWTRVHGGIMDDVGYSVQDDFDGGSIIAGYTTSYGTGNADIYFVRMDPQGTILWTQLLGSVFEDMGRCIIQTSDSGYVCCGLTNSFGSGGFNYIAVKLAPDTLGVHEIGNRWMSDTKRLLYIYPNPSCGLLCMEIDLPGLIGDHTSLRMYDCLGRKIKDFMLSNAHGAGSATIVWDMSDDRSYQLSDGVYFFELKNRDTIERHKVIYFH